MRKSNPSLSSEIAELETILSRLPTSRAIERFGLQQRLDSAKSALERSLSEPKPERAQLTFKGAPVNGSRGVDAEFGSRATIAFAEAFTATVAGMNRELKYKGPIKDKAKNQLLITGTAVGSFGFEFELPRLPPQIFSESGGAEEAFDSLFKLVELSGRGSDDQVTEAVASLHPRAVKKISGFLGLLSKNEAWCGLQFKDRVFRYDNLEELRSANDRLRDKNIRKFRKQIRGQLLGILPKGRSFEFDTNTEFGLIRGKLGPDIENPDILNRDWLYKDIFLTADIIQVGQGRPTFTLPNLESVRLA